MFGTNVKMWVMSCKTIEGLRNEVKKLMDSGKKNFLGWELSHCGDLLTIYIAYKEA